MPTTKLNSSKRVEPDANSTGGDTAAANKSNSSCYQFACLKKKIPLKYT